MGKFINELCDRLGQGTLADKIGIDASSLSRFRSGQGTMNLANLEAIFQIGDALIISREEDRERENAVMTVCKLWERERARKPAPANRICPKCGEKI